MLVNRLDLDIAVADGIISQEQAAQLRDLSVRELAADDTAIDFSQDARDEPFRFLRGFRDVFIAIGVVIFAVGLSATESYFIQSLHIFGAGFKVTGSDEIWSIPIALGLCVFGFLQAEFITRKQRLPLSSLVVSIAFAGWSALLFWCAAGVLAILIAGDDALNSVDLEWISTWAAFAGAIVGSALFYWRFRLPFALFLFAGLLVGLSLLLAYAEIGEAWFSDNGRILIGLWGFVIFAAAMWFDVKDRLRVTRFSECAFWLHLAAAPMLVHAFLFGGSDDAPSIAVVLATMAVLSVIALLIDRRALLVSGLGYFAGAIWEIVADGALSDASQFMLTMLILGGFMLTLGLGWTPIRRRALAVLPFEAVKSRLPPSPA